MAELWLVKQEQYPCDLERFSHHLFHSLILTLDTSLAPKICLGVVICMSVHLLACLSVYWPFNQWPLSRVKTWLWPHCYTVRTQASGLKSGVQVRGSRAAPAALHGLKFFRTCHRGGFSLFWTPPPESAIFGITTFKAKKSSGSKHFGINRLSLCSSERM